MLTTVATLSAAPAYAADVDDAVNSAVDIVQRGGSAVKSGLGALGDLGKYLAEQYDKVSPGVNKVAKDVSPVVKRGADELGKVAAPLAERFRGEALPQLTEKTQEALRASGVDVDTLQRTAGTAGTQLNQAAGAATPTVTKIWNFLTTSDPATLGKTAAVAIVAWYVSPLALGGVSAVFRGYSGDVTPARAVDIVAGDGDAALIDLRSVRDKEAVGVPDVPGSARGRFIQLELASIDRRLRGQLRNADGVEAQVTALEVSALKRVNKNSKIILMDKNGGGQAKAVARELRKRGFGNVYLLAGGFSGWSSSKLQVRQPTGGTRASSGTGGGLPDILGTIRVR